MPEITYATHEYDDVLDMFYAKARMYDADNRRFAAVDPILEPSRFIYSNYWHRLTISDIDIEMMLYAWKENKLQGYSNSAFAKTSQAHYR